MNVLVSGGIDDRETRIKTGKTKKTVEFTPPIGKAAVYYTGHKGQRHGDL